MATRNLIITLFKQEKLSEAEERCREQVGHTFSSALSLTKAPSAICDCMMHEEGATA
jgi:hypothetical protein